MSKVQLLLDVIINLCSLADSLQAVADAMMEQGHPTDESQEAVETENSVKLSKGDQLLLPPTNIIISVLFCTVITDGVSCGAGC